LDGAAKATVYVPVPDDVRQHVRTVQDLAVAPLRSITLIHAAAHPGDVVVLKALWRHAGGVGVPMPCTDTRTHAHAHIQTYRRRERESRRQRDEREERRETRAESRETGEETKDPRNRER
jgi:hypothetical protein